MGKHGGKEGCTRAPASVRPAACLAIFLTRSPATPRRGAATRVVRGARCGGRAGGRTDSERRRCAPFTKSERRSSPAGRRPPPSSSRSRFYEWARRQARSALFTPLFVTSRSHDWARAAGTPFTRRGGRRGTGRGAGAGAGRREAGLREVVMNLPPPAGEQNLKTSLSRGGNSGWGSARSSGCYWERRPERQRPRGGGRSCAAGQIQ